MLGLGMGMSMGLGRETVISQITAIDAPANMIFSLITASKFVTTWEAGKDGLTTDFRITISIHSDYSSPVINNASTGGNLTYTLPLSTILNTGTLYYVKVVGTRGAITSAPLEESQSTLCAAPTQVQCTESGEANLKFEWDDMQGATSYRWDLAMDAQFDNRVHDDITASVHDCNATGLERSTTYYFRVRAINDVGASLNSSTVEARTK
jgi:hypothetical protein